MSHKHSQFVFVLTKTMCNVSQTLSICFCVNEKHVQCFTNIDNLFSCLQNTCAMAHNHCVCCFCVDEKHIVSQTLSICFCVNEKHVQCLTNIANLFSCQQKTCAMPHRHCQFVFGLAKNIYNVSQTFSISFCVDENHVRCPSDIVNLFLC